ncbi:MAG: hypothetical protein IH948_09990, partial [Bacteroidetes bacterium]|nr:hypothetical protein [Bacteroidota bacterium]
LWGILKEKLYEREHANLEELKEHLIHLWNRIPISLCRKLIDSFNKKIDQVGERHGKRFNRLQFKQKKKKLERQECGIEDGIKTVLMKLCMLCLMTRL